MKVTLLWTRQVRTQPLIASFCPNRSIPSSGPPFTSTILRRFRNSRILLPASATGFSHASASAERALLQKSLHLGAGMWGDGARPRGRRRRGEGPRRRSGEVAGELTGILDCRTVGLGFPVRQRRRKREAERWRMREEEAGAREAAALAAATATVILSLSSHRDESSSSVTGWPSVLSCLGAPPCTWSSCAGSRWPLSCNVGKTNASLFWDYN